MGQQDVYEFLIKNAGDYFSTNELSRQLGINLKTCGANCKRLEAATNDVKVKSVIGKTRASKRYAYIPVSDSFEQSLHMIKSKIAEPRFGLTNKGVVRDAFILTELIKIREALESGIIIKK